MFVNQASTAMAKKQNPRVLVELVIPAVVLVDAVLVAVFQACFSSFLHSGWQFRIGPLVRGKPSVALRLVRCKEKAVILVSDLSSKYYLVDLVTLPLFLSWSCFSPQFNSMLVDTEKSDVSFL